MRLTACRNCKAIAPKSHRFVLRKIIVMCLSDNHTAGLNMPESVGNGLTLRWNPRVAGEQPRSMLMEQSHVSALQFKHEGLERKIQEEMTRPVPDFAQIQLLKKRKLRIKEELAFH